MGERILSLASWVAIFGILAALCVWLYANGHPTAAGWTLTVILVDAAFGKAPQARLADTSRPTPPQEPTR